MYLDPELAGDVLVAAFVTHRGCPGDHAQSFRRQRRELGDDLVRHRIAEVLLGGIAAQIEEWKHHDSRCRHRGVALGGRALGDGCDKAVAVFGERLDEPWMLRRVAEGFAQPRDGGIQVVLEVYENVCRPEPVPQLLSRDDLAGLFEEVGQNLEGFFAEADLYSSPVELPGGEVDVEVVEADRLGITVVCARA